MYHSYSIKSPMTPQRERDASANVPTSIFLRKVFITLHGADVKCLFFQTWLVVL